MVAILPPSYLGIASSTLDIAVQSDHIDSMADGPITFPQVLREEYQALRPDADFASQDVAELFAKVHQLPQPLSALCISGGGIRSATFALGAIQGLAENGLLDRFDYLSTVSGGGYIGSWLTSWSKRAGG